MQYIGIDCALRTFGYAKITINIDNLDAINDILNKDIDPSLDKAIEQFQLILGRYCSMLEPLNDSRDQLNLAFRNNDMDNLAKLINELSERIDQIKKLMKTFVVCDAIGVVDILQGKTINDVSDSQRVRLLREWLDQSPINIHARSSNPAHSNNPTIAKQQKDHEIRVSIELQPPKVGAHTTHHSENVSMQLAMYYCTPGFSFAFTDPKRKKSISLVDYDTVLQRISAERSLKRANSVKDTDNGLLYKANKVHSAECLEVFEKYFTLTNNHDISKSLRNHCADALLMAILLFQSDISREEVKKKVQKKKKKKIVTAIDSSNILA